MNIKSGKSKSAVFLMELIVAILIFAICGAICINIFGVANKTVQYSTNLRNGSLCAQNMAEGFKGAKGNLTEIQSYAGGEIKENKLIISYDENWSVTDKGVFFAELVVSKQENNITSGDIRISDIKGDEIFSIRVSSVGGGSQ